MLQEILGRQRISGGCWRLHLLVAPGDEVRAGDLLAYLTAPEGAEDVDQMLRAVEQALDIRLRNRPRSSVDSGMQGLAAVTVKGTVQGDLDVAFEGVEAIFALLPVLAARPAFPACLRLAAGAHELLLHRRAPDKLAKMMRELTVVSEVALAPSLPLRVVTEVISERLVATIKELADRGEWEASARLLHAVSGWYQSAFFHMSWINGKEQLAADLVELALAMHGRERPQEFEAAVAMIRENADRLTEDHADRQVLSEALRRIAREAGPAEKNPASEPSDSEAG